MHGQARTGTGGCPLRWRQWLCRARQSDGGRCAVADFGAATSALEVAGYEQALYANTEAGLAFAFHDATTALGHMIEVYEGTPRLRAFYAMVAAAAANWDGSDPVRVISR